MKLLFTTETFNLPEASIKVKGLNVYLWNDPYKIRTKRLLNEYYSKNKVQDTQIKEIEVKQVIKRRVKPQKEWHETETTANLCNFVFDTYLKDYKRRLKSLYGEV